MRAFGSAAAVIAAIHEDVEGDIDRIAAQADRDVDRARLEEGACRIDPAEREMRLTAARREAFERLARAEWLDARAALEARERWMAEAVARGRQRLEREAGSDAAPAILAALAAEGIARLNATRVEIVVAARDLDRLDQAWRDELTRTAGCAELRVVAGAVAGGCVVRTVDGRLTFDNTWEARARRFADDWRGALGRLYEEAATCRTTLPAA